MTELHKNPSVAATGMNPAPTELPAQKSAPLTPPFYLSRVADMNIAYWLRHLKVGQKIGFGYALSLGIGVAGIAFGFALGEYYQQQAWRQRERTQTQLNLIHRLQVDLLQTQAHQQRMMLLVEEPERFQKEYAELRDRATKTLEDWGAVRSLTLKAPPSEAPIDTSDANQSPPISTSQDFVTLRAGIPEAYFEQLDRLVRQIYLADLSSPEDRVRAKEELQQFASSPIALRLDRLSEDVSELIAIANAENQQAEQALRNADRLRWQVVALSSLISLFLATVLTVHITRAIVRPLKVVTYVAKQVTQASDFDLKAPVVTADEVGVLADSFNQLIVRVKQLLLEQQAIATQQLIQSEKMSSLGRMVAGVAHEINNPVNFIYGNLLHLSGYIDELFDLLKTYETEIPNPPTSVANKVEEMDLDFLKEDLPKILVSMKVGADRTRQIVLSLRNFSRLDEAQTHPVNLHDCLDSTLLILHNRIKKDIAIECRYGDLPPVEGYTGALFQVFMNLLSNAVDALEETPDEIIAASEARRRQIVVTTECCDRDWVAIRIADNGKGIPPEVQKHIFETFFTTKAVGVGTGLGLPISREIVEEKHGGRLLCQSEVGVGTEFTILLPVQQQPALALAEAVHV